MQAWAQPSGYSSAGGIYTCVNAQGRRLTADRPIAECVDREQRVLGPSGTERQRLGPTLTDQERAVLEAQRRKEAEERARAADERRRERVLVARYPDQASHDAERAAAIQQVNEVTAVAEKRVADLQRQRKTLDTEMEFYRRDPSKAPVLLRRQIAEQEEALAEQQRFIAGQEQEKRRVHQRFDAELAQLKVLWTGQRSAVPLQ
ncbi:DUF4124 domain-containing protein [Paracidovorax valerianellae]|uniref:DUF4124 domain-containing protein n=1 Tax=Paracidovorax valerianellae TaxID=187868 RepID=A0A1G7E304_9BURK|nr:DUF4124 domain-containing protein [Paracidovorax valerianellae]MDA8444586.1 DUF4124 domain-containing protein [Paracidovorax valerianellae]SDE58103.1 hypothetical protein SAMN05192589_12160 [Paracidovorax valerianellae]